MDEHFQVHWYPGHMAKAKRELTEAVRGTDFIVEVADARAPHATRNPEFDRLAEDRPRILLLSKVDLADQSVLKQWIDHLTRQHVEVMDATLINSRSINRVRKALQRWTHSGDISPAMGGAPNIPGLILPDVRRKRARGVVVGMPNTGKSTLIKALGGRGVDIGAKPGVTRRVSWVPVSDRVELLDTPGLMWPRAESGPVALKLAWLGSVSDAVFDVEKAGLLLISWAEKHQFHGLFSRFDLSWNSGSSSEQILTSIAFRRGHLLTNGQPDLTQAARSLIYDFRTGRLGLVCLDDPGNR